MQEESLKSRLRSRGICVIIPTYNNAGTIVDVVRRSLEQCDDVIVVCDGCTDGSLQLLEAMSPKAEIVRLEKNRGKGIALREGFRHARQRGFAYAITLDGDGQHFPEDIASLLEANIEHPGAIIVGSRKGLETVTRSKGSSFANKFSNFWFALQTGQYLPDTQTGYRLYPLQRLRGLGLLTSRYEAELELLVFASWAGVKLVSCPVNVFYPAPEERVSHFRPGRDFLRITALNAVLCLLAVVYGYPRKLLRGLTAFLRTAYSLFFFVFNTLFLMTPLVHLYLAFGEITEKKKYNLHRLINFMARFLLFKHRIPGTTYSESNPGGEDFSKPSVIICNHQSHIDLVPLLARAPKVIVLTADWVWNNPLYRFTIRCAEYLPASAGMDAIMPQLRSLVSRGYSIAIYPEGTRSLKEGRMGRFHQGAFHVAQQLGVDIVPMIVYGTGRVLPKHGRIMNRWPIHVEIDNRISPQELLSYGQTTLEQAKAMRQYFIRRHREISDSIEQNV